MTNQPISRRKARSLAFQFLYGNLPQAQGSSRAADLRHTDYELFCTNFGEAPDEFGWELSEGTGKNIPSIDGALAKLSTNWKVERMSRVDLTILRLAVFEILFRPDVPKAVAINEAVELAKSFGSEDSASFVNGLLDKFAKPT